MIDLKKLITGFLILASAASFSVLILSSLTPNPSRLGNPQLAKTAAELSAVSGVELPAQIPDNAFVEQLPQKVPSAPLAVQSLTKESSPSNNLTLNFVAKFSSQVLAHNPEGPQSDSDGNPTLSLPTDSIIEQMISDTIEKETPDDALANTPPKNVHILDSYSNSDIANYIAAANGILAGVADGTKFDGLQDGTPNPQIVNSAKLTFKNAAEKTSALQVPKPFAALHKSLINLLTNQTMAFEIIAANYETDPLRAIIAIKNSNQALDKNFQDLESQVNKLGTGPAADLENDPLWLSFVHNLLGVEKAHAIFGLDPENFTSWARLLEAIKSNIKDALHYLYTTFLRILVNQLINQFQNQVVNWIQGGGSPRFVTNWKSFLSNTLNQAAGAAIDKIVPGVCSSFGPLIRLNLKSYYANENLLTNGCTLERIVGNLNNFYDSFTNGGWAAYGESILPSGNYYGSLFASAQEVDTAAQRAKEAASAEAQSSSGFLPDKKCARSHTLPLTPEQEEMNLTPQTVCDEYINNTPGSVVGHSLFTSLGWKGSQIVSAQRLEELAAALIDASINRIIKTGLTAVNTALSGSGGTINTASGAPIVGAGGTGGAPPSLSIPCDGLTGQALEDCLSGLVSGTGSGSGGATPPPPPGQLTCSPETSIVKVKEILIFSASGGDGVNYSWHLRNSDLKGTGPTFGLTFPSSFWVGAWNLEVSSGGQTATCRISVTT